jgi:hypothetical protein
MVLMFEHVCVDYMSLIGVCYGVFVDRYTGWTGMYRGDAAKAVITFLARLCAQRMDDPILLPNWWRTS